MFARSLACLSLWILPAISALAAPQVQIEPTVTPTSTQWAVSIKPDVESFVPGSSLAVELDFQFESDILSATLNSSFWNVNGINTGNNPFTGAVTAGLVVDSASDTLFVAAGSELYQTADWMPLMTVETSHFSTYLMGGRPVLAGTPQAYTSSRIAQNGVNHDGLLATIIIDFFQGDFDGNGFVGNSDLTLLLDNWGDAVPPVPAEWDGVQPSAPAIGNDELTGLLDAWGDSASGSAAPVPEPATLLQLAFSILAWIANPRRSRCSQDSPG